MVEYLTNERLRLQNRGNASSDFALFTMCELSKVWKRICNSGINIKIEIFNAFRKEQEPFPLTIGEARDLAQQTELTEMSKLQ